MALSHLLDRTASLAMIAASVAVLWTTFARQTAVPTGMQAVPRAPVIERIEIAHVLSVPRESIDATGRAATIALIEFSDFQCPFCARYALEVYPEVWREWVNTEKVQYLFHHFPLEPIHPLAVKAAEAVECAGQQDRHREMRDSLFANQRALTLPDLVNHANGIGLDRTRFERCMTGEKSSRVREDIALGKRLGISSTPTFFVGRVGQSGEVTLLRKIHGAQPYAVFKSAIEELLN